MAAAVPLGVLYDFPQHDGGESFERALQLGIDNALETFGPLPGPIELHPIQVQGLPTGTEDEVARGFRSLADAGVIGIVGPSISDNGVLARDLADAAEVPCINYTGGEITRSRWMFHYQVGSLTEEPIVVVEHVARLGGRSIGALYDDSIVGHNYAAAFARAASEHGLEVVGLDAVSPTADDLSAAVKRLYDEAPEALVYLGLGMSARPIALAVKALAWQVPVVCNSSLMFGYRNREWRADWQGWAYIDTVADDNPVRAALMDQDKRTAAGPVGVAAYDIGRLMVAGLARAPEISSAGLRDGLEQVKRLPSATGYAGTTMGFGVYDHGALKGSFLVLREWRDGRTVQLQL